MRMLFFLIVLLIIGCSSRREESYTPQITDSDGNTLPGSIASMDRIVLNGVQQQIIIRGVDTSKPIILMLHGGPGTMHSPFIGMLHTKELEENFIVVQWDQRGAGLSYSNDLSKADMNIDILIEDTIDLTNYLRKRFRKDKIYILGHSFGSGLGFNVLMRTPNYKKLFKGFISIGEAGSTKRRFNESIKWLEAEAIKRGDKKAVKELKSIAVFDPLNMKHNKIWKKYLSEYKGDVYRTEGKEEWMRYLKNAPEWKSIKGINVLFWLKGNKVSRHIIDKEFVDYDLFRDLPNVEIPVVFFAGRYDYQTPSKVAKDYFDILQTPYKKFIWFEESSHMLPFEEIRKFNNEIIKTLNEINKL